ncbi:MAG: hypothetical protein ABFE01_17900, partial [Phycisphaerales bacterium]
IQPGVNCSPAFEGTMNRVLRLPRRACRLSTGCRDESAARSILTDLEKRADVDRMIAAVRAAWSAGGAPANLTYQTPDDYSRFQGEQQEAFWKWLEPAARPASR